MTELLSLLAVCSLWAAPQGDPIEPAAPLPASDPNNGGGWVYNDLISDEFEGTALDENRWFIVGQLDENGEPQYVHPDDPERRVWKGRAPAQFSGRNHRLEDGILILETRWEPDFPFSEEITRPAFGEPMDMQISLRPA